MSRCFVMIIFYLLVCLFKKTFLARDTIHLRAVRLPVRRGDDEQRRAQHGHLQLRPEDLPRMRLLLRLLDTQGKEHSQMTSTEGVNLSKQMTKGICMDYHYPQDGHSRW